MFLRYAPVMADGLLKFYRKSEKTTNTHRLGNELNQTLRCM